MDEKRQSCSFTLKPSIVKALDDYSIRIARSRSRTVELILEVYLKKVLEAMKNGK